ncbi:MAG TPA: LytTR family DNA-binding domain-containing protein [Bacteroidales bacterium]|nr:LytTR family DNA-binding domain-containing protein [Bacteroidales bacterium]
MRTVIIEDELPQAEQLKSLVKEVDPSIEVVAIIQSVEEAVEFFQRNAIDLVFLDIHLADGLCFEIFDRITLTSPVIFTTAYDQYAIDAFRHNGIDYLLKPVTLPDLKKSISKYRSFTRPVADYNELINSIRNAAAGLNMHKKRFISRSGKKLKIIPTSDIAYFYALGGGVFLKTYKNENLLTDKKMEELEQELDPYEFFRLNRKVIANVSSIREMLPYSKSRIKVILQPPFEEDVIISYQNVKEFMRWVKK